MSGEARLKKIVRDYWAERENMDEESAVALLAVDLDTALAALKDAEQKYQDLWNDTRYEVENFNELEQQLKNVEHMLDIVTKDRNELWDKLGDTQENESNLEFKIERLEALVEERNDRIAGLSAQLEELLEENSAKS